MFQTTSNLSAILITIVTVDRFLAVCFPLKLTSWRRPSNARRVATAVYFIAFIWNSPIVYTARYSFLLMSSPIMLHCDIENPSCLMSSSSGSRKLSGGQGDDLRNLQYGPVPSFLLVLIGVKGAWTPRAHPPDPLQTVLINTQIHQ